MTIDEFIRANQCNKLYHMSEKGSWSNIQQLGLLSTSTLLDLCGYTSKQRFEIESQLRETRKPIKHPKLGFLYVRDQIPMRDWPEQGICLDDLLEGVNRQEWFEFLNSKVFFWVPRDELIKMICAWQYSGKPQWVITVNTRQLLQQYSNKAYVSDQNTGSLYSRRKRGPKSFVPFNSCSVKTNIKELAIDDGVPNLADFAVSVDECIGNKVNGERIYRLVQHIWP